MRPNRQRFKVTQGQAIYYLHFSVRYITKEGKEYCIRRCIGASRYDRLWMVGKPSRNVAIWLKENRATVELVKEWNENGEQEKVANH